MVSRALLLLVTGSCGATGAAVTSGGSAAATKASEGGDVGVLGNDATGSSWGADADGTGASCADASALATGVSSCTVADAAETASCCVGVATEAEVSVGGEVVID
jgi:hypothetical protein